MSNLIHKLDLDDYISSFESFFARTKKYTLDGDIKQHFKFIEALDSIEYDPPKKIGSLDESILRLKKYSYIPIEEIATIVYEVRYFRYLQKLNFSQSLKEWVQKVEIPSEIEPIVDAFERDLSLKIGFNVQLDSINNAILMTKKEISEAFNKALYKKSLEPYLVDRSIHIYGGVESLLVRGGFGVVLEASIIGRSSGGFFYIVPKSVDVLESKLKSLIDKKEQVLLKIAKDFSNILIKWVKFVEYLDVSFDRFDHYSARVEFARAKDYHHFLPTDKGEIILKEFVHPALKNPKPINIEFKKSLLLLTGVNAGGKTMMLKSLLTSAFLAKNLLPFRANKEHTKIGRYKNIFAILDDPQSVKDDISTFAGRMLEFANIMSHNLKENNLIGIDEVELGTDSDEASALYKAILSKLKLNGSKIVVTTHHKRLAALMASDEDTELSAAIYDIENAKPTYEFLHGIIGKSYAFETASKYHISHDIIKEARAIYGEEKEHLSELIQNSYALEAELKSKIKEHEELNAQNKRLNENLKSKIENFDKELEKEREKLNKIYYEATALAKEAIKSKSKEESHKLLNLAYNKKIEAKTSVQNHKIEANAGDYVSFKGSKGKVLSISGGQAMIEFENGMKFRVKLVELNNSPTPNTKHQKSKITRPKILNADVKLDLHGQRVEEALENLDSFINNALLAGFDEVLIFHGVGSGVLAKATKEFLSTHPNVISFDDAPPNMGGIGAKIVKL